jgi:hypothetical protein
MSIFLLKWQKLEKDISTVMWLPILKKALYLSNSRLYSDYAYFNKYNVTPKDFHNRVVKGIGAFETCLRFQNIEECANNFNQKDSVSFTCMINVYLMFSII